MASMMVQMGEMDGGGVGGRCGGKDMAAMQKMNADMGGMGGMGSMVEPSGGDDLDDEEG